MGSSRSLLAFALAAAVVFGVSATPAAAEDGRAQQPSILTILSGTVFVRHGGAPLAAATDGEVLAAGDVVQTTSDARAIVTMFEGSTIEIEPSTLITIDDASRRETSTFIQLTQLFGRTWHVVTHLLTPDSKYDVRTPAATASVRGTVFEVAVLDSDGMTRGTTSVTTVQGAVATSDRDGAHEVLVTPATTTTVAPGSAPTEPRPAPDVTHVPPVTRGAADAQSKADAAAKSDGGERGNGAGDATKADAARDESRVSAARGENSANGGVHASEASQRGAAAAIEAKSTRQEPARASQAAESSARASIVPTFSLPAIPTTVTDTPKANGGGARTNTNEKPSGNAQPSANAASAGHANDHGKAGDQGRRR